MLPGVGPGAVVERIADFVVSNLYTVVGCQQVAPFTVIVGVEDLRDLGGGIGVLSVRVDRTAEDIARIVIGPGGCESRGTVMLPDQLVGRIVQVVVDVGALQRIGDVAVGIAGSQEGSTAWSGPEAGACEA